MTIQFRIEGVSGDVAIKYPCRVATTANISLAGLQTINGVNLVADDRVLVRLQTDATENGIYSASTSSWQRTMDFDGTSDVAQATIVRVQEGSTWARSTWEITTENPIIGTTTIDFNLVSSSGDPALDINNIRYIAPDSGGAEIQANLDYLDSVGGGTLYITGNQVCNTTVTGYTKIKVIGGPDAVLDFSGMAAPITTSDSGLFVFRGTAAAEILLTADAVYGANDIYVPDATVFSVGDLVEVSMADAGSFNDTSVAVRSGQLNIITGVYPSSGNKLILDTVIFEVLGYATANGARIRKVTPVEDVLIDGIKIIGVGRQVSGSGDQGLKVFFGKSVTIQNCVFQRVDGKSVEVVSCYHFKIDNCYAYLDPIGTNSTVSYGIAYSTSMYGTVSNNKVINARHGIVSSHLSAALTNKYYGVSRFIVIENNAVTGNYGQSSSSGWSISHAGIACHFDVEFLTITKNTVSGCRYGINVRTFNIIISENQVIGNIATGILLTGDASIHKIRIVNNRIIPTSEDTNAITFDSSSDSYTHDDIIIDGNHVSNSASIAVSGDTANLSTGLSIVNNVFDDSTATTSNGAIYINGKFTGVVANNVIKGCVSGNGIGVRYAAGLAIKGNHIYDATTGIQMFSTTSQCIVDGNVCAKVTTAVDNDSTTNTISNNADLGSGAL